MKKIFLDTNIIIDLLAYREPHYKSAAQIFSLADKGELRLFVSALSIANTNYILSKVKGKEEARSIIKRVKIVLTVLDLNDKIIDLALNDAGFSDFEDGLQYHTAVQSDMDIIITRNLKDFKNSAIAVMNAQQFMAL